jgi:hypothetical protein
MIEELVETCAANTGLNEDQARSALSGALFLMRKHGDPSKVDDLFAAIPGSAELAEAGSALTANKGGGLMAGLMNKAGGAGGAVMSDAMAMNQQLTRKGVTMSDMQKILPLSMSWVKARTGEDKLRDVFSTIPGLGPLLVGPG